MQTKTKIRTKVASLVHHDSMMQASRLLLETLDMASNLQGAQLTGFDGVERICATFAQTRNSWSSWSSNCIFYTHRYHDNGWVSLAWALAHPSHPYLAHPVFGRSWNCTTDDGWPRRVCFPSQRFWIPSLDRLHVPAAEPTVPWKSHQTWEIQTNFTWNFPGKSQLGQKNNTQLWSDYSHCSYFSFKSIAPRWYTKKDLRHQLSASPGNHGHYPWRCFETHPGASGSRDS